jgi:hypothetical protein
MDKSVDRVHVSVDRLVCSVHRGTTPAQTEGTAARSPELGLRPLRCAKARQRGGQQREGSEGNSARFSPELGWR